jgi:hypothetical protein
LDAVTKQVINDKLKNLSADDNKSQSMDESILMEKGEIVGGNDGDRNSGEPIEDSKQSDMNGEDGDCLDKEVRY